MHRFLAICSIALVAVLLFASTQAKDCGDCGPAGECSNYNDRYGVYFEYCSYPSIPPSAFLYEFWNGQQFILFANFGVYESNFSNPDFLEWSENMECNYTTCAGNSNLIFMPQGFTGYTNISWTGRSYSDNLVEVSTYNIVDTASGQSWYPVCSRSKVTVNTTCVAVVQRLQQYVKAYGIVLDKIVLSTDLCN